MPTTSNFGWTTPADTDLVKDGAAAIRTLGNGIDTSLVDLKGGTTGQVLSKASNTDLDFTWSSVDPLTILDAKGDLISATAADTPARLASSGVNGDILTVDTSTATGLKWAAPAASGANWSLVNSGGTTLSGTTTTISGISNADKIFVYLTTARASASNSIRLRLNTDTGNNYIYAGVAFNGGSTYAASYLQNAMTTTNNVFPMGASSSSSNSRVAGWAMITGCNSSGLKIVQVAAGGEADTGNGHQAYFYGGYYNSSSTISSISINSSGGSFNEGTVYVYKSA